jgi:hypothetical protein
MVLGFGKTRYIAPRHGFDQDPVEAWTGMSSTSVDLGGPDDELMSQEWPSKNIQVVLLGQHYPGIEFSVEGDTPALLYNIPKGLGDSDIQIGEAGAVDIPRRQCPVQRCRGRGRRSGPQSHQPCLDLEMAGYGAT